MSLLANLSDMGHINEAVSHFNHAIELTESNYSKVDVARSMFDGLNKIQTEWHRNQADRELGQVKAFQTMIIDGLPSDEAKNEFIGTAEVQNLVTLDPKIMSHNILNRRGYKPNLPIEPQLGKEAAGIHQNLENAYNRFVREGNEEEKGQVIKRVAELLYIVRSNLAHGEKTPSGPDLIKRQRDEQVCNSIIPLLELLIDILLGRPSKKLVSYGTLSPEQPNHQQLADLKGDWEECVIRGSINQDEGLLIFSWNPRGVDIKASLFFSEDLPNNWERINRFEGSRYRHRLVPTETQAGIVVGYTYMAI